MGGMISHKTPEDIFCLSVTLFVSKSIYFFSSNNPREGQCNYNNITHSLILGHSPGLIFMHIILIHTVFYVFYDLETNTNNKQSLVHSIQLVLGGYTSTYSFW